MGFPTKNDHFGVFWGYYHSRKHLPMEKKIHKIHCCDFDFDTSQTVTSVQSCQLRPRGNWWMWPSRRFPNEKLETSGAASGNGSTWIPWMWMDVDGLIGSNDSGAM